MQHDLVAKEVLNILMESGLFRNEELALEALQTGPDQWVKDLEEEASYAAITSLQHALTDALARRDFKTAKQIREKINQIARQSS
jgi:excinuclease UvrABC helicase subunit UvrB